MLQEMKTNLIGQTTSVSRTASQIVSYLTACALIPSYLRIAPLHMGYTLQTRQERRIQERSLVTSRAVCDPTRTTRCHHLHHQSGRCIRLHLLQLIQIDRVGIS